MQIPPAANLLHALSDLGQGIGLRSVEATSQIVEREFGFFILRSLHRISAVTAARATRKLPIRKL